MRKLEFYVCHNGAYRYVPHKDEIGRWSRTNFVSLPTSFYDNALGLKALDEFVETLVLAEKLGYDGLLHTEQHGSPIGMSGNAMVLTAWLAAETERILLCAVGPILNAYLTPVRLAEEIASSTTSAAAV